MKVLKYAALLQGGYILNNSITNRLNYCNHIAMICKKGVILQLLKNSVIVLSLLL